MIAAAEIQRAGDLVSFGDRSPTFQFQAASPVARRRATASSCTNRMTEGPYSEEDLRGLSTDLVSPGVVALAAENAPSRVVLLAGAGAFEQAHVTMTRGIHVGDRPDAAERIAAHWDAIADRSAEQVPVSGAAQYHHEVNHPARPAHRTPDGPGVPLAAPV